MPSSLKDIADVVMGYSPPGVTCNTSGVGLPLLNGPTEYGTFHPVPVQFTTEPRRIAEPGDLLFCVRGSTTGRMNWADQQYAIGRGIAAIRHRAGSAYQSYLRAVVEHQLPTLLALATGSTFPSVARDDIAGIAVPDLDSHEQLAISRFLQTLDDKIEQNRRTGSKLEGLARGIFKAWFVDFEPVKAKAAGATSFPGMPPETFASLPTGFTNSDLGPIPEGWEVGKLGENSDINKSSVKSGGMEGEIEYIDIASVTVGQLSGVQRVDFVDAPGRARRRVHHGDTIWSCVRPNRRSHLFIHSPPLNRIASTGFAVISPRVLGAAYIYEATTRQEIVDYLVANADGSAYPAVRAEHFASADVLVPAKSVRDAFEQVVMRLRDLIAAGDRESAKLVELRDYLLPRLLSGQVRVVGRMDRNL